jgi:thiamine-phosphate pyrophosphorylase
VKTMAITGRSAKDEAAFSRLLKGFSRTPPDYLQVRDKGAPDRRVLERLQMACARLPAARILANGRFDLALAAGAHGVVLPADGLPIEAVRRETPRGFVVGKSTHSPAQAREALAAGADLVLLGPIFETPSKRSFGPPLGPESLEDLPERDPGDSEIFLVGGMDLVSARRLMPWRSRFDGVAAIRLFEEAADPSAAVAGMRPM